MKKIDKKILKELNSFEVSELQRVMEAVEAQEYYYSGYKHLCGGYADTEITDILIGDDYDEENDVEYDLIEFALESGVQNEDGYSCHGSSHTIPRRIINDTKMSMKEKLQTIKEA